MNRPFLPLLVLILAGLVPSQLTYAQHTGLTTDHTATAALREKAFKLLESLADQLGTLQSAENRARMGSNIAGSLWPSDEKRARALFKLVEDDIRLGFQQGQENPEDDTLLIFLKLREDTVERMVQHDPELALAFIDETFSSLTQVVQRPDGTLPRAFAEKEQALQVRLANKISAHNPQVAAKLARQSLDYGFSNDLPSLLRRISAKDKQQAQSLYKEIVSSLRDANVTDDWRVMIFFQDLIQIYAPPDADESTYRELLNIYFTAARAKGCLKERTNNNERSGFCQQMSALAPVIERFDPAQASRLKQWLPFRTESFSQRQAYAELDYLTANGTVDEILALTSKYPQMEGHIRLRAMSKAESAGDVERVRKIASAYNGDPGIRRVLNERMNVYETEPASADGVWAEVQNRLSTMAPPAQIQLLLGLAHQRAPHDRKTALKALTQLSEIVNALKPGRQQTESQLAMALIYSLAKSDRGFAIMESLMPKLNELVAAAAKLDGYDSHYLRDGEWNMSGQSAVGRILTRLANNAGYFAWCDFDRAVALAGQFERSEIRMMAQLKLAQGILAGPPKVLSADSARH